ncbi:hypothetical protein BJV85_002783 [Clostridium acetobutylicum]|nr:MULTISPECIES: hypothetical protein [Clostridium]NOV90037.1 hypothetical protein [Clostridium acetobutylicum]NOW15436.1 hypothetical protein [Clostridium acetobutylicum]NRY57115.1 hypothetical protein [Clostridium acetobutylicum]NSA93860.1 hypothetical protein [Clostridium acetobutylicum]NYC94992.1 hypothetical protein [Clostridium acetobutylicum]
MFFLKKHKKFLSMLVLTLVIGVLVTTKGGISILSMFPDAPW